MKFLPIQDFLIDSPLDKEEAMIRLSSNTEPKKTFRWKGSGTRTFEGELRGEEFEITRIINYRNSFLPIIKGRIENSGQKTRVTIKMRLHGFVAVFVAVWLGGVGSVFLGSIAGAVQTNNNAGMTVGAGLMFLFGYGLTMGAFLFESSRAKEKLLKLFEGRIVK